MLLCNSVVYSMRQHIFSFKLAVHSHYLTSVEAFVSVLGRLCPGRIIGSGADV